MDSFVPPEISLGVTHRFYPEYYLFGTEACSGWNALDRGVKLGSWHRAEQYAHDIIEVRSSSYVCQGPPPMTLQCRFYRLMCVDSLFFRNWRQARKASMDLVCFFVFILSPRTLNSIHSIHFAWMHPGTRHLENKEEFVYVAVRQNTRCQSNGLI